MILIAIEINKLKIMKITILLLNICKLKILSHI